MIIVKVKIFLCKLITFCFVCPIARVSMSVPIKSYEHDSNKLERLMEKSGKCHYKNQRILLEKKQNFFNLTGLGLPI